MKALLVVDIQNDFCPGGALAIAGGDEVISSVNELRKSFPFVIFTQDWHPADHLSFAVNHPGKKAGDIIELRGAPQVLWPAHCVQDSFGALFHSRLDVRPTDPVFRKGTDRTVDSYSAFYDNAKLKSTGLSDFMKRHGVDELMICGLATDYCVKYSVLDALTEGFQVSVATRGCRGVNLNPGDSENALRELEKRGAILK